jgi:NAD(P)-dependent dehydrogenase (short-subunit alcohol dehydrogenase family)
MYIDFSKDKITNVQYVTGLNFNEPASVEQKFIEAIKKLGGDLDHLFLCHGILSDKNLTNGQVPDFDNVMRVNVRSHVHMISLAFPFMKLNQSQRCSITVLTSAQCDYPDPRNSMMSIGAAMVKQLVACTALEGAYYKIRVNAVATGVVASKAGVQKKNSD